tara:strand:+ start:1355 stop:1699 length:345 start_codon:yes stop_codon:yes gene_type:complete
MCDLPILEQGDAVLERPVRWNKAVHRGERMMNDHQDSEHFMGVRMEDEIFKMLDKAERRQNDMLARLSMIENYKATSDIRKKRIYYMRNYKALEGVVKTLRWCLGDKCVEHPLE